MPKPNKYAPKPSPAPSGEVKHFFQSFTYDEWIAASQGKQQKGSLFGNSSHRTGNYYYTTRWSGTDSWEEAVKLMEEGWPEGVERIGPILENLDRCTARSITVPQPALDVSGDYVDIDAYLDGIPENMVRWEETESTKRVARILLNMGASAGVSKSTIEWRGATVLALIDRLEVQGIRAELDAVIKCRSSDGTADDTLVYNLKKASDPLHLDRLAFQLVNAAAFRRIGFAVMENRPPEVVNSIGYHEGSNYGIPMRATLPDYDLIVPELHLYTVEDSVKEIEKMFGAICQVDQLTIQK